MTHGQATTECLSWCAVALTDHGWKLGWCALLERYPTPWFSLYDNRLVAAATASIRCSPRCSNKRVAQFSNNDAAGGSLGHSKKPFALARLLGLYLDVTAITISPMRSYRRVGRVRLIFERIFSSDRTASLV